MFRISAEETHVDGAVASDGGWIFGEVDLVLPVTQRGMTLSDESRPRENGTAPSTQRRNRDDEPESKLVVGQRHDLGQRDVGPAGSVSAVARIDRVFARRPVWIPV